MICLDSNPIFCYTMLGEVGLDADNAASQEIVDKEIVDLEKAGDFGEEGSKANKKKKHKQKMKEMLEKEGLGRKDGIGKHGECI